MFRRSGILLTAFLQTPAASLAKSDVVADCKSGNAPRVMKGCSIVIDERSPANRDHSRPTHGYDPDGTTNEFVKTDASECDANGTRTAIPMAMVVIPTRHVEAVFRSRHLRQQ
jgi:hypothetical protein